MKKPVYLDNHSTTPLDPRVFEAMKPYFLEDFGNAGSSSHEYGERAFFAVKDARSTIQHALGAMLKKEIIFTSGATESNNIALMGIILKLKEESKTHIITSRMEHKSILELTVEMERRGFDVSYIEVKESGELDLDDLKRKIKKTTGLVSIMHANNEIGIINPIVEIGQIVRENQVLFHCDAAQSFGKVPLNVEEANIDFCSISAHKIYGPKGVGALYIRSDNRSVELNSTIFGGGQELGIRSGTLPVPLIVGFSKSAEIAIEEMSNESIRIVQLRNQLLQGLKEKCSNLVVNGTMDHRLPNNLNVSFLGIDSETFMTNLWSDIAVSDGSACTSENWESSYVLKAMSLKNDRLKSAIRFGLGRFTTEEEIKFSVMRITDKVNELMSQEAVN